MQINSGFMNFSNYTKAKLSTSSKSKKEIEEQRSKFQDMMLKKYSIEPEESSEETIGTGNEVSVELDTYEVTEEDRINIKVQFISEKLKSGAELSDKEMDFLSKYAPGEYEVAMMAKKERESYEREAKSCKTKDDVRKLKTKKDQHFLSNIKIAEKSGNTSEALKQITLLAQVTDEHRQFVKGKRYRELPDKKENEAFNTPSLI